MAEPKPTETPRPKLRDLMIEEEGRWLLGRASPGVPDPDAPAPAVNEEDLLTACDLAEEAGAPPKVVAALKYAVVIWKYHQRAQVIKANAEDAYFEMLYSSSSGQRSDARAELIRRHPGNHDVTSP